MMKLHGILNSDAMKTLIWQIEIIIPSLTPPAWRCVHTDFPSPFPFEAPSTCLQDKISTMSPGNLPKCMLQVLRGGGGIILILEQKWLQNLILLKRRQNIMQNKYQYLPPSVLSKVLIFLKFNTYWKLEIPLGPSPGSTTGWHCSHSTCQHLKRCDNSTVILHSEMSYTYTAQPGRFFQSRHRNNSGIFCIRN